MRCAKLAHPSCSVGDAAKLGECGQPDGALRVLPGVRARAAATAQRRALRAKERGEPPSAFAPLSAAALLLRPHVLRVSRRRADRGCVTA